MPDRKSDVVDDPKRLRALAHPLRWELMDLLSAEGSATATRCAEVLGQSVASCSYHLNMLAKYGFVEEAPGDHGRERPWRLTSINQTLGMEGADSEGFSAEVAATSSLIDHHMSIIKRSLDIKPGPGWEKTNTLITSTAHVTAEEARQLAADLMEIASRFDERIEDPAKRPEGAREFRMFLSSRLGPERPPKH